MFLTGSNSMPYPTHHHSLFSSFTSSSTFRLPPAAPNAVVSSETVFQIGGEMGPAENGPSGGGQNDAVDGDDCFVDQLLNLDADVDLLADNKDQENMQISEAAGAGAGTSLYTSPFQSPAPAAGKDDLGCVLTIPEEEPHLEWLSHFVEDSFSPFYPASAGVSPAPENPGKDSEAHNASPSSFSPPAAVPRSRRSKRPRCAAPFSGHNWLPAAAAGSPPLSSSLTESTTTSSSCSSATSSPWPPTSPSTPLSFQTRDPNKKLKKTGPGSGSGSGSGPITRKCSHCGTQKTPQWRAGPMGSKTLCNACGVRFKSGRLLPEYRPACSPTFSSELHSNGHRKVLEMRKKKEVAGQPEPGLGPGLLFGYRTS